MDAKEAQVREKLEDCLKQATKLAAQLQAIEQGGKKLSRVIQGERVRELALKELKGTRCPGCNQLVRIEIEVRNITSMDGPIELTEPVAKCRRCRRSFFPSADRIGDRYQGINAGA